MSGLVDEEEVYRFFGGCLPVDSSTTENPSLKHQGNLVDKERDMLLNKQKLEIRGQACPLKKASCPLY
jgi:hypothetical protein